MCVHYSEPQDTVRLNAYAKCHVNKKQSRIKKAAPTCTLRQCLRDVLYSVPCGMVGGTLDTVQVKPER